MTQAMWYWADGEERQGPVDTNELRDMLEDRRLPWTALVWRPGMERWSPAAEVADLEPRNDPPPPEPRTHDSAVHRPSRGRTVDGRPLDTRPRDSAARAAPPQDRLAPFWRRGVAKALDLLIIVFGMQLLLLIAAPLLPPPESEGWQNVVGISVTLVVYWLYFSAHEGRGRRASLGKQILGIEVVGLEGETLSFGRSAIRAAVQLFTLGWLMAFMGTTRQSLHDRAAASMVVMREAPRDAGD